MRASRALAPVDDGRDVLRRAHPANRPEWRRAKFDLTMSKKPGVELRHRTGITIRVREGADTRRMMEQYVTGPRLSACSGNPCSSQDNWALATERRDRAPSRYGRYRANASPTDYFQSSPEEPRRIICTSVVHAFRVGTKERSNIAAAGKPPRRWDSRNLQDQCDPKMPRGAAGSIHAYRTSPACC